MSHWFLATLTLLAVVDLSRAAGSSGRHNTRYEPGSLDLTIQTQAGSDANPSLVGAESQDDRSSSCAPGFSWTLDCERVLAGGVSR